MMRGWARWNDELGPQGKMAIALWAAICALAPCDREFQIYLLGVRRSVERGDEGWEVDGAAALKKFDERGVAELRERG